MSWNLFDGQQSSDKNWSWLFTYYVQGYWWWYVGGPYNCRAHDMSITANTQWDLMEKKPRLLWKSEIFTLWATLPVKMFGLGQKLLDQNFDPSLLTNKLWLVFMRKKQKKIFFWKKKFKMADSKKQRFSKLPILNIFCENFMDRSLD